MIISLKRILSALLLLACCGAAIASPEIKRGLIDLSKEELDHKIALKGEWYHFPNQLLLPQEIIANGKAFTYFPGIWNESNGPESGSGYATFALFIIPPSAPSSLAIQIPQLYSSYSIWINDDFIGKNGVVGKSQAESVPQWMPQTLIFDNPGDTIKLVLQVSNFHHFKGGAKENIYLGSAAALSGHRDIMVISGFAEAISLGGIGLLFLFIYFFRGKKVILYFALLCITWAIRVGFSNNYLFISYFPDFDWTWMIRIEYVTLFLTMIWAALFLSRVFTKEENRIFKFLLVGVNLIFILFTLLSTPVMFTKWLPLYLLFCGLLLLYGGFVVLKGWINQRAGANYITMSVFLGILIFSYDVFSYEVSFAYNPMIFSVAYIALFTLMGIALMIHLNILKGQRQSVTKLTFEDFYKE